MERNTDTATRFELRGRAAASAADAPAIGPETAERIALLLQRADVTLAPAAAASEPAA